MQYIFLVKLPGKWGNTNILGINVKVTNGSATHDSDVSPLFKF
jgi:hypothetical protein